MKTKVDPRWIRGEVDRVAIGQGCTFNAKEGERPIRFIESFCCHSQGEWQGKPFILLDWQRDFLMRLYGWRRADGTRRYRTAYLEVPKKNGKSTLLSGLGLYHTSSDREPQAQVFINAFDRKQASIIYDEAARMIAASPWFRDRFKTVKSDKTIYDPETESFLKANSKETASKDGLNASLVMFDELHRQAGDEMWRMFRYAGAARRQPLNLSITTAGYDRQSICYRQHDLTEKVNSGLKMITSHLGVIYGAKGDDDFEDPEVWRRANPSMGVTFTEETFREELELARETPTDFNDFLRLRLNIWTNASERFLRRDKWDLCGAIPLDLDELEGEPCFAGLDLSSKIDVTAFVMIFGNLRDGFRVKCRFWIPEETAAERQHKDRVPYLDWAEQGWLTLTPGNVVDYDQVREDINREHARHPIQKLCSDAWGAQNLAKQLGQDDGIPIEFIGQGFRSLSDPTKELERLTVSVRLAHGNNPVLNWMADNATAERDAAGNVKLSKSKNREKIDGVSALVDAIAAASGGSFDDGPSIYETRGKLIL